MWLPRIVSTSITSVINVLTECLAMSLEYLSDK